MTRKVFFQLFFIALCIPVFGQNIHLIEDLRKKAFSKNGPERFSLLNDLAWEYRSAYPDSTIYYASQAFDLGKSLNLTVGLSEAPNFIGVAYNYKGDRIKAYEYYEQALSLANEYKDSLQIAYSNNNLGRLFFEQGILSRSYEYFIQAQTIFEEIHDPSGLAYTYQSLARLYKSQKDNQKAENNYLKANRIRISLGVTPDITSAFIQTGRFYQDNSEYTKALLYLRKADSTASSIEDEINLAEIKTYLAKNYLYEGNLKEALATCQAGLDVILKKQNIRMQPQAFIIMGQIEFASNHVDKARAYYGMARDIAAKTKDLSSKMDAHYNLWKLSGRERNKTDELQNLNQYLILKDSIKDLDLTRQVERFQFEIEIGRKEQENALLKVEQAKTEATIKQQKLQNIILLIIILFVSVLGVFQWRSSKKRREINEKLEQQNQFIQNQRQEIIDQNEKLSRHNHQLSELNHEKDTLMGIVAHDLKSPINRIKGLSDLMELEGGLTDDQQQYVKMIKDATQGGLDLIKDLLDVHMLEESAEPNYSTFDISSFLLEKVNTFVPVAESKHIHLHISQVENIQVKLDSDYLSRILDNLLTNALKFSNRDSAVEISAVRSGQRLVITVKDQGQGFSEKDKQQLFQKFKKLSARPTAGESSNGLGLAIVKILVDRMKGNIDWNPKKEKEANSL